jgi:cytochrome c-type biogenesis protein CcsB
MSAKLLGVTTLIYLLCMACSFAYMFFRGKKLYAVLNGLAVAGFAAHTAGLGLRWYESYDLGIGHIPLANFYESLVSLSWTTMIIYFYIALRYKVRVVGALIFPIISITMAYASLSPSVQSEISPLIPALQSNWLTYHVMTCFLGYSAFAMSFVTSILYLVKAGKAPDRGRDSLKSTEVIPSLEAIDEIIYKTIAVGFLLLTVGIITGAVWANYAWGSYWSWDPKETWSLITWFVYAAFLHARLTRDWRGRRAAIISIAGFVCVLFTFLGVNLLLSGLHSYAS